MTSTKQIALGFLCIAVGFGFFFLALTGIDASPNTLPANLFVGFPSQGDLGSYASDLGNAVKLEQFIGLLFLAVGLLIGAIGCFRRD